MAVDVFGIKEAWLWLYLTSGDNSMDMFLLRCVIYSALKWHILRWCNAE